MKNKNKSLNHFKLSLNSARVWENLNFNSLCIDDILKILYTYHLLYKLKTLASRGVNLTVKNLYIKSRYKKKAKKVVYKRLKKISNFFFFLKKKIYMRQYFRIYNQFKFLNSKKKFLTNILPIFSGFTLSHFTLKQNLQIFQLKLYFNVSPQRSEIRRIACSHKKNLNKKKIDLLLLFLKYKIESDLNQILKKKIIINFINLTQINHVRLKTFNKLENRSKIFLYSNLAKLQRIRNLFFTGFITGFNLNNPQLIAEQIALGLNRIRKQKAFFYTVLDYLKEYIIYSSDIVGIRFILCGKLGAKTRTQLKKFTFRKQIKVQTLALKVDYGFAIAETFTGTFGIHIWLYRNDVIQQQDQFRQKLKKIKTSFENISQKRKRNNIYFGWGLPNIKSD